jgi:hypothetical protein
LDHIKAADWKRLGWIASVIAFVVVNVGIMLPPFYGNGGQVFPGLVAAAAVWMYCNYRANAGIKVLGAPDLKTYILPRHEVIKVLQDTVPNINWQDRWWVLHWKNDQKGEMKFRVNYELPSATKGRQYDKQQIVLDVYLTQLEGNAKTGVKLIFNPDCAMTPDQTDIAHKLITHTTDSIDYQIKLAEQGKM